MKEKAVRESQTFLGTNKQTNPQTEMTNIGSFFCKKTSLIKGATWNKISCIRLSFIAICMIYHKYHNYKLNIWFRKFQGYRSKVTASRSNIVFLRYLAKTQAFFQRNVITKLGFLQNIDLYTHKADLSSYLKFGITTGSQNFTFFRKIDFFYNIFSITL